MARSAGQTAEADAAEQRADGLRNRFDAAWWIGAENAYADSLPTPATYRSTRSIGSARPDGGRADRRRRTEPASRRSTTARPASTRARPTATAASGPAAAACSTRAAAAVPRARASSRSSRSAPAYVRRRGQLRPARRRQQRRYTDANAETQFSEPATGGRPMSSRARCRRSSRRSRRTRPSEHAEHRPLLDLPLDVHAVLGPLRHGVAGDPPAARRAAAPGPRPARRCPAGARRPAERAGRGHPARPGSADVLAAHDGNRYTTVIDHESRSATFRIGHTLPRGARSARSCSTAGAVADFDVARDQPRHSRCRVKATPGRRHTLVVTAG